MTRTLVIASKAVHAQKLRDMYPEARVVIPGAALYGERFDFIDDRRDPTIEATQAAWEREQEWLDCEVRTSVKGHKIEKIGTTV